MMNLKHPFRLKRVLAYALLAHAIVLPAQAQFTVDTRSATAAEQASLDAINRFRADPQGELARMLGTTQASLYSGVTLSTAANASDGTDWSTGFWASRAGAGASSVASAMDFFHVNPGDLLYQWSVLPASGTLHPLSWNANLGHSSLAYAGLVVADAGATSNPHTISPYAPFGFARYTDAGYTSAGNVGENIARNFPDNTPYAHAGFAVDWGGTANGIQDPAGHRTSMLSASFTEIGIGIASGYGAGNVTQVQHFGDRFDSVSEFVWGYAWQDAALGSYTYGEGMAGLTVQLLDGSNAVVRSATTDANGGYTMQVGDLVNGNYTVRFMSGATVLDTESVTLASSGLYNVGFVTTPVPEPSTLLMFAAGGLPLVLRASRTARKRRQAA